MLLMMTDWRATDECIRKAALRWLDTVDRNEVHFAHAKFIVPELGGVTIRALSAQNGIWKPRQMRACLSVMTSHQRIYDDHFSEADVLFSYKYRAQGGYDHSDNRSLRLAMTEQLPVLYFMGIGVGRYAVEVVRVVREMPGRDGVLLGVVSEQGVSPANYAADAAAEPRLVADVDSPVMAYRTYVAKTRLHQAEFRQRVMQAYKKQCAICRLKRETLLDAAHIIPDASGGKPEVPNGLSLCRIHHGAYDQNILGIDPDCRVHINQDMLEERDGPMLRHGFQEMDQRKILVPRSVNEKPDKDKLARRFEAFRDA